MKSVKRVNVNCACTVVLAALSLMTIGEAQVKPGSGMTYRFAPVTVAKGFSARICYFNAGQTTMQVQVGFQDAFDGKVLLPAVKSAAPNAGFCSDFTADGAGGGPNGYTGPITVVGFLDCDAEPTGPVLMSLQILESGSGRVVAIANPPIGAEVY